ncbi:MULTISPECIES: sulfurtransferase TusA family protein [Bacteroidaceae]|jgi:TusA-related sulfurtransferase|uniref:Sulfurtransferase TusA family protein n=1 Tax=Bacteroides acidifaciens TaxID=85831 RepID=A0A3L8AC43_9BACE|nr:MULTISPECIES: sulfurtransferase TusA family protein [Bacteroidaceae]MCR2004222.1 sulfurtransferase TusA family protein [Bacteroides acidifaciens]RLT81756.1 sulfurtransferase TusA family protein [Bacteroides acidifaciens]TGY08382.1 sulfurtransferase TusA family protein [Bacteroides acidifaciens]
MITVDTRGTTAYSPLIPAIKAMCDTSPGETIEIIMNHADAFQNLKEYLSEQGIGFREIYDGEQMTLEFTINKKF